MRITFLFMVLWTIFGHINCGESSLAEWKAYKVRFNKEYSKEMDLQHQLIFEQNVEEIQKHNERYGRQLESYKKGINQFTDQSIEERIKFSNPFLRHQLPINATSSSRIHLRISKGPIPDSFSWLDKGAVTPVKDQKHCGSCYAFASNVAMEAQYFFKTGELRNFSEQNLLDCAPNNDGCNGGYAAACFDYAEEYGIMYQEDYEEYKWIVNSECKMKSEKAVFPISQYSWIEPYDEEEIKRIIATTGPVVASIDSRHFHDYAGGILDKAEGCGNTDHLVGLVGYGEENGKPYYLVKNSWGDWWGEKGYLKLSRNVNYCSVAELAMIPHF